MPSSMTTGMRYTKPGMVCMMSSTGVMTRCRKFDFAIAMPIGMPSTIETKVQTNIIETVRIVSSHMSK